MRMASRRNFLARSTAFGAVLLGYSSGVRAAATERLTLGFIGLGERGIYLLNQFLAEPDIEIVAVCDPYELHYREREWGKGKALGRRPACDLIAKVAGRTPAPTMSCLGARRVFLSRSLRGDGNLPSRIPCYFAESGRKGKPRPGKCHNLKFGSLNTQSGPEIF